MDIAAQIGIDPDDVPTAVMLDMSGACVDKGDGSGWRGGEGGGGARGGGGGGGGGVGG